jgi:tetratricopeptide (TPR) repeat protein
VTTTSAAVDDARNDSYVPAEIEKQLNEPDTQSKSVEMSHPTGEIREIWITARKAFYQRDYELAESSYQQVIDSSGDNFDAYGELGNVYFNQGKHKEAAAAYFEAAAILVNKGQIYRAKSLIGLLRHLDSSKADELQKMIDGADS